MPGEAKFGTNYCFPPPGSARMAGVWYIRVGEALLEGFDRDRRLLCTSA